MNFAPFSGQVPAATSLPTIHQFAAKFGYEGNQTNTPSVVQETSRYQTTVGANVQFAVAPSDVEVKYRQNESVVVVSAPQQPTVLTPIHTVNTGVKYQTISASTSSVNLGNITYGGQTSYVHETSQLKAEGKREYREEIHQDIMATMMQQQGTVAQAVPALQQGQQLLVVLHEPKEAAALARAIKQESRQDAVSTMPNEFIICSTGLADVDGQTWQLGSGVADYLSALPLPLHHLLKYTDKRDEPTILTVNGLATVPNLSAIQPNPNSTNTLVLQTATLVNPASTNSNTAHVIASTPANTIIVAKKKKKRKSVKEKKPRPRPGEIRLTTALDGSTLYCCPECHMAYPEKGLLEQHLVGHTMERRYICDICNAALKRKDHLTRHKQSHNPDRPHVCSVCLKAFKRKEQLTLHFVIHSGEKRHICNECGKGFYRKDHLRKHTRSHIARRVKAELSQTAAATTSATGAAVSATATDSDADQS